METILNKHDATLLKEMRVHLGKLHQKWRDDPESDGHCKSNEGYVGIMFRLPNWFECSSEEEYANAQPEISMIEVYSYLFGPNRLHSYETMVEAHQAVMSW